MMANFYDRSGWLRKLEEVDRELAEEKAKVEEVKKKLPVSKNRYGQKVMSLAVFHAQDRKNEHYSSLQSRRFTIENALLQVHSIEKMLWYGKSLKRFRCFHLCLHDDVTAFSFGKIDLQKEITFETVLKTTKCPTVCCRRCLLDISELHNQNRHYRSPNLIQQLILYLPAVLHAIIRSYLVPAP